MSSTTALSPLTTSDVMRDLEVGRSLPPRRPDRLLMLPGTSQPAVGGGAFRRRYLAARILGRIHPRLARTALLRLWFTPWVHASARRIVTDLPVDLAPWSLRWDGGLLRGFVGGTGPTIVLVHGWAGRAADWRHLAGDLVQDGWRVVAPDLPAHGMTEGDQTDLFELGRALAAVLDDEHPAAVVTHSMGFPTTVRAIQEGAAPPDIVVALAPGRKLGRAVDGFSRSLRLGAALTSELRRGIEQRFGPDVWDRLDVDPVLPGLTARGVVVHDTDDTDVPMSDGQAIVDRWPAARLVETSGLGHRRIVRDEAVRRTVRAELSQVRASAPGTPVARTTTPAR